MPDNESHSTTSPLESGEVSFLGTIARIVSQPQKRSYESSLQRLYIQCLERKLMPHERIHDCLRKPIPGKRTVDVMLDRQQQTAHYRNLITCGSVWICAVCASRITEQRADELQTAVTKWHTDGGFVGMLTFTLRHSSEDNLVTVLDALRNSYRYFKMGRSWSEFQKMFCWQGSVTALEVTHGESGWHPHLHALVFFDPMGAHDWREFQGMAKTRWLSALERSGRDATWENGLDIRDSDQQVYDYIAKFGREPIESGWTLEREIAKAAVKKARHGGRTPQQLVLDYGDGDAAAGRLFQEYAAAFKGRNQLVWSRGLRSMLQMGEEKTDEELAETLPDNLELFASFNLYQWRRFLALPDDLRGYVLAIASDGDKNALRAFLGQIGIVINCDPGDGHAYDESPAGV